MKKLAHARRTALFSILGFVSVTVVVFVFLLPKIHQTIAIVPEVDLFKWSEQVGGGVVFPACAGSCVANLGAACTSPANSCAQTTAGTVQCDGTCSATAAPALPAGYGSSCTSPANACGQTTTTGTIACNGSCSSVTPPLSGTSITGVNCSVWDGVDVNGNYVCYGGTTDEFICSAYSPVPVIYTNNSCHEVPCFAATPPATASFSASPTSIAYGAQATLSWSSTDATSCTAGGPWSNASNPLGPGSGLTNPLTTTTTFTFQCTGAGGTSPLQSVTVTVAPAPVNGSCSALHYNCAAGTSTNNVNGVSAYTWSCAGTSGGTTASCSETKPATVSLTPSPATINAGQSTTLTWSSTNAVSCTWANGQIAGPSGTLSVSPAATTSYGITCGTATTYTTVTVLNPKIHSFTATPSRVHSGDTSVIAWSTSQANNCVVSGPGLSVTSNNGSQPVTITSKSTYTITCDAIPSQTATVNVVPAYQQF